MRKFVTIAPALIVLMVVAVMLFVVPQLMDRYAVAQQGARISVARNVLAEDDILRRMDRAISAIGDAIEPTVVHIETQPVNGSSGLYSSGAGWIYDNKGHLITNAHVVKSASEVSVEFYNGGIARGRVIGSDIYTDIAVIAVDASHTNFPAMRAAERLPRVGERVYAFGSPFGFKFSMSEGIVSGLGRQAQGGRLVGGYTNYIQTDAAVNPGNSGGPLVNTDGHVIGMNVAIATAASTVGSNPEDSGGDSAGISFAIPLGTIEPIVSQIIEHGSVSRGYMGISYDGSAQGRIGVETSSGETVYGILINGVEEGGPSDRAGVVASDVILKVQGSPVTNAEALSSLISSQRAGEPITLELFRDGNVIELEVTLDKMRPEVLARRLAEPIQVQMGALFSESQNGVLVYRIWRGFPASMSGLVEGDVITLVKGQRFSEISQFFVLLADSGFLAGDAVPVTVRRADGSVVDLEIQVR